MSRLDTNRLMEDCKRRIIESVVMIQGLISLLNNHKDMLEQRGERDPSGGTIPRAEQADKDMAEKLKEVLELEELQID